MATGSGTGTVATSGAITKGQVLAAVLQRLRGFQITITDIDRELLAVLYDLSSRNDFLLNSGTITTADGDYDYDVPSYFKREISLRQEDKYVLDRIPYSEFQQNLENTDTPLEGDPYQYALWNEEFYLWPVPDDTYTIYLDYAYFHPSTVDTISFGETFREAIYTGVLMKLWQGQLAHRADLAPSEYMKQYNLHMAEIQKQLAVLNQQYEQVRYRDI